MKIDQILQMQDAINRRTLLRRGAAGLGLAALTAILGEQGYAAATPEAPKNQVFGGLPGFPNFPGKAKRVIYLFQSGAPSQLDMFDYKPDLVKLRGTDLPSSIRNGQRLTGMTSGQASFPVASSLFDFKQYGQSGMWLSELLPHTSAIADDICLVKSMFTEEINHDPAITFLQTGNKLAGRPSSGAWVSYGLGTENHDLPAYVVLTSFGSGRTNDQPLYDRLWGSGFLPTNYQGVKLRNAGDPVLFLSNPAGEDRTVRRGMLDELDSLNKMRQGVTGDPEISTRISQYELAFRMQTSVPDLADMSKEPQSVLDMYGPDVHRPGSYAANCLMARRLSERGVRFVQLFHMGWDHHQNLPMAIRGQNHDTDQASAALITDLKQRGLLDETIIVWGGEFGRTVYSQGTLTSTDYGRDHHPRCFSMYMAGGGIKGGMTYGETDDYSYNITQNPVSIHDLHATILHQLGVDHKKLTFKYQGRDFRLTDVSGNVVTDLLA